MNEEHLLKVAYEVRQLLEPHYVLWHQQWGGDTPKVLSTYTCMRSSHFLKRVLDLDLYDAAVATGARLQMVDSSYTSHAWVEVDQYIIDITSDQFGEAPVLLLAKNDGRYAANKAGFTIDEGISRQKVVDSLLEEWLAT